MASSSNPQSLLITLILILSIQQPSYSLAHEQLRTDEGIGSVSVQRKLLGFKETPSGGNSSFECSPSGPCVPCDYSEKNNEKYRCSETGYRIPFKCVKIGDVKKDTSGKRPQNSRSTLEGSRTDAETSFIEHRKLADSASVQQDESQTYVTYRSCIQAVNEEKLSVLGFEVLMLGLLLVSGSFVFFRKKRTQIAAMPGVGGVRIQSNPRF